MSTVYQGRKKRDGQAESQAYSTTSRTVGVKSVATTANTLHTLTDDQIHTGRRLMPVNKNVPVMSIELGDIGNKKPVEIDKVFDSYSPSPTEKQKEVSFVKKKKDSQQQMSKETQQMMVRVLCITNFLSNISFTLMSPFYPIKATKMGVSKIQIGYIFSVMAFAQIVSSIAAGKFMHFAKGGRHQIILFGSLLIITQTVLLGTLEWITDLHQFLVMSFIAQSFGGLGCGMNNTAVMAMLSGLKNEDRERSIGYLEVSNGIGILCGPLIGALLFNIGGYHFPFLVFAILYLCMYPIIGHYLFKANSEKKAFMARNGQSSQVSEAKNYEKDPIKMSTLFSKPRFLFGIWAQLNTMMALQFIAPNIAVKLHSLGFDQTLIGVTYGTPSILYACTCPFIYLLTSRVQKRGIIVIGFLCISISMLMIGGNEYIREYQKETFFILWGLIIIGMSAGMVTIPVLPEMLDAINEDKELIEKYDNEYIQNIISGLFISFQSIGEAAGPILSQTLITYYGFQTAYEIFSNYLMLYCLLYFLFAGNFEIFGCPCCSHHEESDDDEINDLINNKVAQRRDLSPNKDADKELK